MLQISMKFLGYVKNLELSNIPKTRRCVCYDTHLTVAVSSNRQDRTPNAGPNPATALAYNSRYTIKKEDIGMFKFRTLKKEQLVEILIGIIDEIFDSKILEDIIYEVLPDDYNGLLPDDYDFDSDEEAFELVDMYPPDDLRFLLKESIEGNEEKFIEYFGEEEVEKATLFYLAERG